MSWGFITTTQFVRFACTRATPDGSNNALAYQAIDLGQNVRTQAGNTWTGIKPGFPLGFEPDYNPALPDGQGVRYDAPVCPEWREIVPGPAVALRGVS